jgi:hypothetical protein
MLPLKHVVEGIQRKSSSIKKMFGLFMEENSYKMAFLPVSDTDTD